MNDLEIELLQAMIKIKVRYSDGLERIQSCLNPVEAVAIEMANDPEWKMLLELNQSSFRKLSDNDLH